ncbi:MAG: hypothetical protein Q8S84_03445 [bacterium]|nr:hypothetical protein [bacterium]
MFFPFIYSLFNIYIILLYFILISKKKTKKNTSHLSTGYLPSGINSLPLTGERGCNYM